MIEGLVARLLSLYFHGVNSFFSGVLVLFDGSFPLFGGSFTLEGLLSSLLLFKASLPNTGSLADSDAYSTNSASSAKHAAAFLSLLLLKDLVSPFGLQVARELGNHSLHIWCMIKDAYVRDTLHGYRTFCLEYGQPFRPWLSSNLTGDHCRILLR